MSNDITVTLSGNSTPLLPLGEPSTMKDHIRQLQQWREQDAAELTSLRARLAEAEAMAGRAEEAVRVLAEYAAAKEACDGLRYRLDDDFKDEQTGEDRSVEYKDKGQRVYRARKAMNANDAARAAVEGAKP